MIQTWIEKMGADEKRNGSFSTTLLFRRILYAFLIFWIISMMVRIFMGFAISSDLDLANFLLFACGIAETSFQAKRVIEGRVPPQAYISTPKARKKSRRRRVLC